ncbi:MAG: bifunctional nicotinamidase/pyrazinamidase [Termitinemataceae bacterium]|nr:MAG: bifunctional nicotinamidase/pyrazinamidase [Termitinemataceae bacterium]
MNIRFEQSALIEIDVQNDFCPGGALAVQDGDKIVPHLNEVAREFYAAGSPVIATQDWHPSGHCSFASSGRKAAQEEVLWPDHCVFGSMGADFHPNLDTTGITLIIRKGFRQNIDSYSAFFENDRKTSTGLAYFLKGLSIDTLYIGGLATDYCVYYSVMDAINLGFKVFVLKNAIRGVDYPAGSVEKAIGAMQSAGVIML